MKTTEPRALNTRAKKDGRRALAVATGSALWDLEWAYNRLDHLITIAEEGCWDQDDFSGPLETMAAVAAYLPELRRRYGFQKAWPNGRCGKPNVRDEPRPLQR